MTPDERTCRFCGRPLPKGALASRLYCSEKCRRDYQNERRKDERAEARELRNACGPWLNPDPWWVLEQDLSEEEAAQLVAGIDPLPAYYAAEADALAGPLVTAGRRRPEKNWKKNWLRLW